MRPSTLSHDVPILYKLVWREFKRTLIHEYGYVFRSDERTLPAFRLGGEWPVHYFMSRDNRHLVSGFPDAEPGGKLTPWGQNLNRMKVYMDDLFLCPNCGAFDQDPIVEDWPTWVNGTRVDKQSMWAAIDSRRPVAEFTFRECRKPDACQIRRGWRDRELREAQEEVRRKEEHEAFLARVEKERQEALTHAAALANRPVFIYAMEGNGHVKIGRSLNVAGRLKGLQTSCPFPIVLLKSWVSTEPARHEAQLHARFAQYRKQGEWFLLPAKERTALLMLESLC